MSEAKYRMLPDDIGAGMFVLLMVRWCRSRRSPLLLGVRFAASGTLQRSAIYGNLGQAAPGKSTGEAMELMEQLGANCLPVLAMTGRGCPIRNVLRQPGTFTVRDFVDCRVPVSAALYESWSIPFSVMLVVPLGLSVRCWLPPSVA